MHTGMAGNHMSAGEAADVVIRQAGEKHGYQFKPAVPFPRSTYTAFLWCGPTTPVKRGMIFRACAKSTLQERGGFRGP